MVELFIDNKRVDLFDDESINVVDSIKNVRDIAKIFTTFTQIFSLPATQKNNEIFRHYYNFDLNNSYDARVKKQAVIKINGFDKYKGLIQLNSVSLKNNKPSNYKVFFTGSTLELSAILNDALLQDLESLNQFNHEFNALNIIQGLKNQLFDGAIKYPFISAIGTLRTTGVNQKIRRNKTSEDAQIGVDFKPALQVYEIVKAIEVDFPRLQFESDFFESDFFKDIYLWLHRGKGRPKVSEASVNFRRQGYTNQSGDPLTYPFYGVFRIIEDRFNVNPKVQTGFFEVQTYDEINLNYTLEANGDFNYQIIDVNTNNILTSGTGENGTPVNVLISLQNEGNYKPEVFIQTEDENLSTFSVELDIECIDKFTGGQNVDVSLWTQSINAVSDFVISQQIPKMKIIDFLTSLFKMFNLVAFVKNGKIQIMPLDDYYAQGKTIDITNLVDISKTEVKRLDVFSQLDFMFDEPKTFFRSEFTNDNARVFGDLNYNINQDLASPEELASLESYEIKLGFQKLLFQEITDTTGVRKDIIYGSASDSNDEPIELAPVLMFIRQKDLTGNTIAVLNFEGTNDSTLDEINEPFNYKGNDSINFGTEFKDGAQELATGSLFKNYYENFVRSNFNQRSRIYVVEAYLNDSFIQNYKLNDVFIVSNKKFRINNIRLNLNTKKAKIELQNIV